MITNERLKELIDRYAGKDPYPTNEDTLTALRELLALRALVLASRPALEFGAYCIERHTYLDNHVDAAQLRALSAYGVGK